MTPAEERAHFAPWARAFEAVYGWGPVFEAFCADVPDGFTLTVRPAVKPIELLGGTGHFRHRPAMVEYVKRLGFGWTDANRIVTMPSPATFNALVERLSPTRDGYRVHVHRDPQRHLALGPYLASCLDGFVPLHVADGPLYPDVAADLAGAAGREDLRFHFASFAHDLTVHALNYHLVPGESIRSLREHVERALPGRHAAWRDPASAAPLTLATFFDNDLNRYGYAVWSRSERPSDFAALYAAPRNFKQLIECLDRRIDETLRGLGDVPSSDTKDMAPLAPCEFQVGS